MKMTFNDLKNRIIKYITKPHHHSTWNLKYLHFSTAWDKSSKPNKHYYVAYGDKSRRFKISMCNNNIKLKNASNIPGSFHDNKGRILGACLDFVRHGDNQAYNSHNYSKDCEANKWEQYDIQQFDKNSSKSQPVQQSSTSTATKDSDLNPVAKEIIKLNVHDKDIRSKMPITFSFIESAAKKLGFSLVGCSALNGITNSGEFQGYGTMLSFNIDETNISVSGVNKITKGKISKLSSVIQDYCLSANRALSAIKYYHLFHKIKWE